MNNLSIKPHRKLAGALRRHGLKNWLVAAFFLIGLLGYYGAVSPIFLGCSLFILALYDFQKRLDDGLPLIQLVAVMATLQWVVGPILSYTTDIKFGRYYMRVVQDVYFPFAIAGTSALVIGLYCAGLSFDQKNFLRSVTRKDCLVVGLALGIISLVAEVTSRLVPEDLQFAFLLLTQFRYIGVLYLFLWRNVWRWPIIALFMLPLFFRTAESAMFHNLLIWCGIVFCYWFALKRRNLAQKWFALIIAAFTAFTIQSIKSSYREKVWYGEEASIINEVVDFWSSGEGLTSEYTLGSTISRINQGWIIAAVMAFVPDGEPHADGETVFTAVRSALIPRIFDSDKAGAGGQENFRRFTGLPLADNTSMAISPLGEAYANYGIVGGIAAMVVYGLLFGLAVRFCFQFSLKHPHFIFWIPLIFYQAIKAETELVTVLNQITKGGLLAFGCYWMVHNWLLPYISSYSSALTGTRPRKGTRSSEEQRVKRQIEMAREARRSMQASSPVECGNSR